MRCECGDPGCARCFPSSYWRERAYERAVEALDSACSSEDQVRYVIEEGIRALADAAADDADERHEDKIRGTTYQPDEPGRAKPA